MRPNSSSPVAASLMPRLKLSIIKGPSGASMSMRSTWIGAPAAGSPQCPMRSTSTSAMASRTAGGIPGACHSVTSRPPSAFHSGCCHADRTADLKACGVVAAELALKTDDSELRVHCKTEWPASAWLQPALASPPKGGHSDLVCNVLSGLLYPTGSRGCSRVSTTPAMISPAATNLAGVIGSCSHNAATSMAASGTRFE